MNWLWFGLAAMALAAVELARRRVQALPATARLWGLAGTAGLASAAAFSVIYLPALLITGLAAGLGTVGANSLGALPLFAAGGFCPALLAIALVRSIHTARRLRGALMLCAIAGLAGLVLARNRAEVFAAMTLAGVGASFGVLVRTQAVAMMMLSGQSAPRHARPRREEAAQRRLNAGEGGAIGAIYATFVAGLVGLLLLPAALPSPEHVPGPTGALTPARWLLLAVAGLLYSAWRILPGLFGSDTPPEKQAETLRDRTLWRAIALTTLSVMALKPLEFRIVLILQGHNIPHPVTWASLAFVTILPTAVFSRQWGGLIKAHPRWAEFTSIAATLAGATIGLLSARLTGWLWLIAVGIAYMLMEVATTLTWACAEAEAVRDPTDIRRISLVNGVRYGAGVPVGYVAVISGSEVTGIWVPAVALAGTALALQLVWRGSQPRHAKRRRRAG